MDSPRAALFQGSGVPMQILALSPKSGTDQALIQTEACTLCSSDLHTVSGRRISPAPSVLGHEAIGRIVQLPQSYILQDVDGNSLQIGQRVVWGVAASCGECLFCRSGIPQKCVNLVKYGHSVHHSDEVPRGGLSELVEIVPGTPLMPLSETIPAGLACLSACAGATVAAVLRQCGDLHGRAVLVLGGGVLGVIACRMAAKAGASVVVCVEPDAGRRHRAIAFGAHHAIDPQSEQVGEQIQHLCNNGLGADFALEFSGANSAFDLGLKSLRTGGALILAGAVFPTGSVAIEPEQIVKRMLRLQGVHNYAPADLRTAVAFLEQEARDSADLWACMIGESFGLDQIDTAFEWAAQHAGIRAVVAMNIGR